MTVAVITADQRGSRQGPDRVPEMLDRLGSLGLSLPPQRTVGDELQVLVCEPATLGPALELLLRSGRWHVGVGFGDVESPVPADVTAGRGDAFLHAREAVTTAKTSPWHLRLSGDHPAVRQLESAVWLWAALLDRRTSGGWEVADLLAQGLTYQAAGRRLGITQSAVSQRAQAAGIREGRRALELVTYLAGAVIGVGR